MTYLSENPNIIHLLENILLTKQYKKRKEFYEINLDILQDLIKSCDGLSLKVRKSNKQIKQSGGYYIMLNSNKNE